MTCKRCGDKCLYETTSGGWDILMLTGRTAEQQHEIDDEVNEILEDISFIETDEPAIQYTKTTLLDYAKETNNG